MTFNPLVTCIIPVYNAEKYLDQGVHSLLNQTYKNVEIILVDDHSTDNSWVVCQSFADQYPNVRAFKNARNSGAPLRGRERGIREAHGEWVTFMDCDDFVKPTYVENLVNTTENGKYDIAVTGHIRLYPDGKEEPFLWGNYSQTSKERMKSFFEHYFVDQDFWTDPADTLGQSLIRASLAKETDLSKYPNTVWGEDSLMALAFLANSKNGVNFVDHHDFYWRQIEGSGSHGGFSTTANRSAFYRGCNEIFHGHHLLPAVSVVIPVYNVERYLRDCLDSVLSQTYQNLEIIVVDDKTPDQSGQIADEYAKKDDRIKVIHKSKNEGLNMARATGFTAVSSKYVLFVDSDDQLVEDCIDMALKALVIQKVDFVRFGTLTFKDQKDLRQKLSEQVSEKQIELVGKKDLYTAQFNPGSVLGDLPIYNMTVWGGLYTTRAVAKVNWTDANFRIYEDNVWTLRFLESVSKGLYLSRTGYLYRSDDSHSNVLSKRLTGNSFNGKPMGYMEFWNHVWQEYRRYNKKYRIGADSLLDDAISHLCIFRAEHITDAGLWGEEGNSEYLPQVLAAYQKRLDFLRKDTTTKAMHGSHLEVENAHLKSELSSHLSIKRSAKLTLGNVKRRIKSSKVRRG